MRSGVGAVALLLVAVTAALGLAACSASSGPTYLTEEIPPCTPVDGLAVDPCDPDADTSGPDCDPRCVGPTSDTWDIPTPIASFLGYYQASDGVGTAHIVIRGTYLPYTVRCHVTDYFRYAPWLNLHEGPTKITNCYGDVRVNSYIYGSGPPVLTVLLRKDSLHSDLLGREEILFLGPAWNYSVKGYQSHIQGAWNVVRENGAVKVVHPDRGYWLGVNESWRPTVEMTLEEFEARVVEEYAAMLVKSDGKVANVEGAPAPQPDANKLHDYYVAVGAMDHPNGPPALPPPVPQR